jgi:hypothetical protein
MRTSTIWPLCSTGEKKKKRGEFLMIDLICLSIFWNKFDIVLESQINRERKND